jgi:beta-glucosidase
MTGFKPKLSIMTMAVAIAISGVITGCNDNSSDKSTSTVKDDAYYKSMAEGLVAKMTVDEKIKMLIGPGYTTTPGSNNSRTYGTDYSQISNVKKIVPGAAGYINGVYIVLPQKVIIC